MLTCMGAAVAGQTNSYRKGTNMPNTVLIGAQWGDEGKGKIIDVLMEDVEWVVRYQGGNNAGHTVEIGEDQYILHLIPSGILRPGKKCVIGNGLVVDILALVEEMRGLHERGIETEGRLFVSDRAHAVLPYHRRLDAGREGKLREGEKIGTTQRGIGPTYSDKVSRTGLRMGDLLDKDFESMLRYRIAINNDHLVEMGVEPLDMESTVSQCLAAAEHLKPYITDAVDMLHGVMASGENILFEGAQGTMLDIDFGTYPFVTSSSATAGGAAVGTGVPPQRIDRVIGVIKAYTTRVGEGPFPTELNDEIGAMLRKDGGEFGATTGRPRRCGWFDAVVGRYSARVNGVDRWALTKLDVLDVQPVIRICVAYEVDGKRYETVPANLRLLSRCRPIYEEMAGWKSSTRNIERFDDLPPAARAYISRLEELTGVPVGMLSVGPRRDATMVVDMRPWSSE